MAKTLKLQVVTPDKQHLSQDVSFVSLPGASGEFGVLPEHASLISALKPGVMKVTHAGQVQTYKIGGGYAEVKNNQVVVLAETMSEPSADL